MQSQNRPALEIGSKTREKQLMHRLDTAQGIGYPCKKSNRLAPNELEIHKSDPLLRCTDRQFSRHRHTRG